MAISDRINSWVEDRRQVWGEALGKFLLNTLSGGAVKFIEDMEPEAIANVFDILEKIKTDENTPPEVRAMVDRIEEGGHPIPLLIVIPLAILFFLPMVFALAQPLATLFNYTQERLLHTYRSDPSFIGPIWLRDKEKWNWLWDDLRDLGYDERRLEAAQELVKIIPPLADMVRFADFGSFDPKIIELWREFYDAPSWISEPMSLLGITNEEGRDWANKYWFSHWRQPGRFELGEIYRRGLLGTPLIGATEVGGATETGPAEELVRNAYLTQGFSAFWQDHLLQLVREIPTRVDVRRWWDMRTIDEAELRAIYQRHGYFGKDLENYVVWTKVYVAFPDLMARWTKGWITIDDVRTELTGLGMPAERVEEMIQTKIKPQEPERVEEGRSLTKTEIYKGVKKGVISWEQGIELLMDLGYDYDEADYILTINVESLADSPETFEEFKAITQKYRIATGREEKPMPEELKKAAEEVVRLTGEVEALEQSIEEEKRGLIEAEGVPGEATARLDELQVFRNRAISELERVKSEYDRLVAEWKHGLP